MKKSVLTFLMFCIPGALFSQIAPQPEPQPIYYNTYYGYKAFYANTTGNYNAAFGAYALYKNTTTHYNTAVGAMALYNATATGNVAVGRRALYSTTTGGSNVAVGTGALENNTWGLANVAVGPDALEHNVTGNWNVAVGQNAGPGFGSTNLIHTVAIGDNAINTASFQVRIGNSLTNDIGGQVSWSTLSDGRFKRDIKEDVAGLDFINKLRPVSYTIEQAALARALNIKDSAGVAFSSGRKTGIRQTGFVAQEVEAIIKKGNYSFNAVKSPESEKDHYSIRYSEFVVPLVKAVQELTAIVNLQQEQLAALQEKLEDTETTKALGSGKAALLHQNFPNPFYVETEVKIDLPETTKRASVIVYNLEGKELKTIPVGGHGTTSVKITRNDLNDGMYLYTLIVDGQVIDTKRFIITK